MDEIHALQFVIGYSGLVTLVWGLAIRKFSRLAIARMSLFEKKIEEEIEYLDSFGGMEQTEKYRALDTTLKAIRESNYRKRFIPIDSFAVDNVEAVYRKYCRK